MPKYNVTIQYEPDGPSGNTFMIMARVQQALTALGRRNEFCEYEAEATSGDFDNLIAVTRRWVNLQPVGRGAPCYARTDDDPGPGDADYDGDVEQPTFICFD